MNSYTRLKRCSEFLNEKKKPLKNLSNNSKPSNCPLQSVQQFAFVIRIKNTANSFAATTKIKHTQAISFDISFPAVNSTTTYTSIHFLPSFDCCMNSQKNWFKRVASRDCGVFINADYDEINQLLVCFIENICVSTLCTHFIFVIHVNLGESFHWKKSIQKTEQLQSIW